jgi:hypothetical protein
MATAPAPSVAGWRREIRHAGADGTALRAHCHRLGHCHGIVARPSLHHKHSVEAVVFCDLAQGGDGTVAQPLGKY